MNDKCVGLWTVQNPDEGQDLGSDELLLLVGGTYHFLSNGYVNINLTFRDRAGALHAEPWVGRFAAAANGSVDIEFIGGHRECFRINSDGQLIRESTSRA